MREGGIDFQLREELPDTFVHGGRSGKSSNNWMA
jgi:hypothetical protein